MKSIEILKHTISSLGLYISSDDFIFLDEDLTTKMVGKNKLPLVIPTPEHVSTIMLDGKIKKIPFNPLVEEAIGNTDSTSTTKVIKAAKARLSYIMKEVGVNLLRVAADPKLEKKADYSIMEFLSKLSEATAGTKAKDIVNQKSIDAWTNICENSIQTGSTEIIKLFSKRRGKINDKTFNRIVTLHSPLLDELSKKTFKAGSKINGVKIPNKTTIDVFKELIKFMLKELNEDNILIIGSNDSKRPCYIATMQLYIVIVTHINKIVKGFKKFDKITYDRTHTDLKLSLDDLEELDNLGSEVKLLPTEKELVVLGLDQVKAKQSDENSVLAKLTNSNYNAKAPTLETPLATKKEVSGNNVLDMMLGRASNTGNVTEIKTNSMTTNQLLQETANTYVPGSITANANYTREQLVYGSRANQMSGLGMGGINNMGLMNNMNVNPFDNQPAVQSSNTLNFSGKPGNKWRF